MRKFICGFLISEDGASAIEYALLASLIATAAFMAMMSVGTSVSTTFSNAATSLY